MQDYRNLKVWRKAHETTLSIYRLTANFPSEEKFGLVSQMRRSAASAPTNITEGGSRGSDADFARLLYIAMGSAAALEYQLLLSRDMKLITLEEYTEAEKALDEIRRMLSGLISSLKRE